MSNTFFSPKIIISSGNFDRLQIFFRSFQKVALLVFEMPESGKSHRQAVFVGCLD
jgi:hypothetical protein